MAAVRRAHPGCGGGAEEAVKPTFPPDSAFPWNQGLASRLLPDLAQPPPPEPSAISRSVHSWIGPHRPPGAVITQGAAGLRALLQGRPRTKQPGLARQMPGLQLVKPLRAPCRHPTHAGGMV